MGQAQLSHMCTVLQLVVSPLGGILNVFVLCFCTVFGILSLKIVLFLSKLFVVKSLYVLKLGPSVPLSAMCSVTAQ